MIMQWGMEKTLKENPEAFIFWTCDDEEREKHEEAIQRSDPEALLNWFLANYPKKPYEADTSPPIRVKVPVLMIHGMDDAAFAPATLNDSWQWTEKDLTLVTLQGVGHFSHHEASDLVTGLILEWLAR
jgi:pimeloyl-ACP methyl ester carboxylesterase